MWLYYQFPLSFHDVGDLLVECSIEVSLLAGHQSQPLNRKKAQFCNSIASYTILIAAAPRLDEEEIAGACEQSLQEEIAMADWLRSNLDATTTQFLERTFAESDAAK